MSIDHYENFPVASLLLPRALRKPITVIYHFARSADDIADEGDADNESRLSALQDYVDELRRIDAGESPNTALFLALRKVIAQHQLPLTPFYDLLSAFAQDVETHRYNDFEQLRDYCRRSANPVGQLVLHLAKTNHPLHLQRSDFICTALQIINFLQDIAIDWPKGRVYVPQQELALFDLSDNDIKAMCSGAPCPPRWRDLMLFQTKRAKKLMQAGSPLINALPGRLRWEIKLTVLGGLCILEKIEAVEGDVFRHRPTLNALDWLKLILRAIRR